MTAADTADGQPRAAQYAVASERFNRIGAACRLKTARRRQHGRDAHAIEMDRKKHDLHDRITDHSERALSHREKEFC